MELHRLHTIGNQALSENASAAGRWRGVDSNFNGTLFVWTQNGRAEVISSIWAIPQKTPDGKRRIVHEFQSLATRPIKAERSGEAAWSPTEAGIAPRPVHGAPKPAATAELRMIQIRAVAREFSATEIVGDKPVELRMLPQPIYRYKSEIKDQPDGAVFALLNEFDPEVFLIIEERTTPNGRAWHWAFAAFAGCRLEIGMQIGPTSARKSDPPGKRFDHGELRGI